MMLTTTPAALLLIKAWEGFRSQTYFDSTGVPTIGFGTTKFQNGDEVLPGDEITEDEADAELYFHVRKQVEPALTAHFGKAGLQPNQRDALASFIYNLGGNAAKWPTLKNLIISNAPTEQIADQWMKYRRAGGKEVTGLSRRRMAEVLVWIGWPWSKAFDAVQAVELGDDWRTIANYATEPATEVDAELFEELKIPTRGAVESPQPVQVEPAVQTLTLPDDWDEMTGPEQIHWLNTGELNVRRGLPRNGSARPVAITSITKKVPIESIDYLSEEDKRPGNITVVSPRQAQRGKGDIKQATGEKMAIIGTAGAATTAIGAAEPIIRFVEKYPASTIAYVFLGLIVVGVVSIYWGKWQRQKGEDEAEDLMG